MIFLACFAGVYAIASIAALGITLHGALHE